MKHLDRSQIYWSRCPAVQGPCQLRAEWGLCRGKENQFRSGIAPKIFEKTVLEAPASLALKVSAGNVVGEAGSFCQKVRAGAEEAHSLGGLGGGRVRSHSGPPSLLLIPGLGSGC